MVPPKVFVNVMFSKGYGKGVSALLDHEPLRKPMLFGVLLLYQFVYFPFCQLGVFLKQKRNVFEHILDNVDSYIKNVP